MESQAYLIEARIAAKLENNKQYHAAMHQWQHAKQHALVRGNQLWALNRADYCQRQQELITS